MPWIFWFVRSLKLNVATNACSVWVKVWPRRPFSGAPLVTPFSFRRPPSVTLFNFSVTLLSCTPRKAPSQVRIQPTRLLRRAIAGGWMLIAQWAAVTFMLQLSFPCLLGSLFYKVNYLHLKVRAVGYGVIWPPAAISLSASDAKQSFPCGA